MNTNGTINFVRKVRSFTENWWLMEASIVNIAEVLRNLRVLIMM